jgi:D-inositol-3-phosphate glycosyltransferase
MSAGAAGPPPPGRGPRSRPRPRPRRPDPSPQAPHRGSARVRPRQPAPARPRRPNARPRVLVVGDAVVASGFARVLHSILGRLTAAYEFHHLGINYGGEPHGFAWEIYPASGEGGDLHGVGRVRELVERLRPRLVFLLNDPWILGGYLEALRGCRDGLKVVAYSPVDAGPLAAELLAPLAELDRLVLYTRFGRAEVESAAAELRRGKPGSRFPPLAVIPHGVDTELFRPLVAPASPADGVAGGTVGGTAGGTAFAASRAASRAAARARLFAGDPALRDAWIVLNANRNQPRKRIDVTIKGFARFARDKPPGVRLYLHMGIVDCGWNVVALARRHGIEDRLIVTADESLLPAVPDEALNHIYNACDVGLNTSLGEGWGLVNLEHAATGAAQVVPRHSACAELWEGAAELLEPAISLTMEGILTEGWLVTPEEVARGLERLYRDPDLLRRRSAAAYAVATRPDFQWAEVARGWDRLFQEVLAEP